MGLPHRIGAVLFALAMLCAGCTDYGGDLSGGAARSGGDGNTVTVSETAGMPSAFLGYGVRRGFFADEGIDLRVDASTGGATVVPALLSEDIDIAGSNVVSAMIAMGRRMPVQMVAAGTSAAQRSEQDFSTLMVPAHSQINRAEDLAGTRIGVNSLQNINDVVVYSALRDRGVNIETVEFVEMPLPDLPAAIERGDVDAGLLIEPFGTIGRNQGLREVLRPYTELRPGLQIGTYLMTSDRVADDPELVRAFQRGVQRTADAIRDDPDAFRAELPELSSLDAELAEQAPLPEWRGRTDRASIELIHRAMREFGLTEAELDYPEAVLR
ncbi:NitT/TauT family transport system substrate-binding protein [Tamaricihabitans halophyticus]|uniref:NitT/TauT family transport system substrate-binding protein n=1 Tax=Tamaricihabitans halophyticus TaxID=1262583 RepID=A0A4V2SVA1_9PSEU|nr:ABC transporter substrate-binding protein [Tamaricihabitans halophyticus]TCP57206.1 NitT/TauT family transport system substrate-binding protein [Tamaricihabitans halophyticus]